jgi:hypothetical protein
MVVTYLTIVGITPRGILPVRFVGLTGLATIYNFTPNLPMQMDIDNARPLWEMLRNTGWT